MEAEKNELRMTSTLKVQVTKKQAWKKNRWEGKIQLLNISFLINKPDLLNTD